MLMPKSSGCPYEDLPLAFFLGVAHSRTQYSIPEAVRFICPVDSTPADSTAPHLAILLSGWSSPSAATKSLSSLTAETSLVELQREPQPKADAQKLHTWSCFRKPCESPCHSRAQDAGKFCKTRELFRSRVRARGCLE